MNKLYHPDTNLIRDYVNAKLPAGASLLISTHLSECEHCQQHMATLTNEEAQVFFGDDSEIKEDELDDAFESLFNRIEDEENETIVNIKAKQNTATINFGDKVFELPEKLAFAAEKNLNWKEFGNDCGVAQITEGAGGGLFFIYMGPGETVPEHGHSGREYSYVVDGYYYSEGTRLSNGDFSVFDEKDTHAPATASDEGCLVVSFVENRLNFFQGLLAPLNRLLWWYLKRS